ncbi:hypothetical protein [Thalassoglobus neptunius]|nr:hypothetical protein [Thalassoglobus neptunius]
MVIRFAIVLASFLILPMFLPLASQPFTAGRILLTVFLILSLLFLTLLGGRVNRNIPGESATGMLSLLALTGTGAWEWTFVKLVHQWSGFLSVWIVRLPILALLFTFGGVRWPDLVTIELLFIALFAMVSAWSMSQALFADGTRTVDWTGLNIVTVIDILLAGPRLGLLLLSLIGFSTPTAVSNVADYLSEHSLFMRIKSFAFGGGVGPSIWLNVCIYLGVAVWSSFSYRRRLFTHIGETPESRPATREEKKAEKTDRTKLPRCWDDALAWQSYAFYSDGDSSLIGRSILYTLAFVCVLVSMSISWLQGLAVLILLISVASFINVLNIPSQCLDKELKTQTLQALTLTPHTGTEIYQAWRRGAMKIAIPDFVYAAAVIFSLYFVHPYLALGAFTLCTAAMISGPFMMVSHLVPLTKKGIGTSLIVVSQLITILSLGTAASIFFHPAAFPFVALPLLWVFNKFLFHVYLEKWFTNKVDSDS